MKKLWTLTFLLVLLTGLSQAQHSRQSDSLALVQLYQATNGDNWTNNENWLQTNLDQWYGLNLNDTGRIKSLHLPSNNLSGELPTDIMNLTALTSIVLRNNFLEGYIPPLHQLPISGFGPQDFVLAYNQYQFKDIAENTAAYNDSWSVEFYPKGVYSYIEKNNNFGKDTLIYASLGDAITLSFPYKTYEDVYFVWYNENNIADTTDTPEFEISTYNDSVEVSKWSCSVKRKKYVDNRYNSNPYHRSNIFIIVSTNKKNTPPSLSLEKASVKDEKDKAIPNRYIRTKNETFPSLEIKGNDAETFTEELQFNIKKTPKQLQYRVKGYPFFHNGPFTGKQNAYELQAYRKQPFVEGVDTLVIEVVDNDGLTTEKVFYFESMEHDSVFHNPFIKKDNIQTRLTDEGIWINWKNLSESVERLDVLVDEVYFLPQTCDRIQQEIGKQTIYIKNSNHRLEDSVFINSLGTEGKNRILVTRISPANRSALWAQEVSFSDSIIVNSKEERFPYQGSITYIVNNISNRIAFRNNLSSPCSEESNRIYHYINGEQAEEEQYIRSAYVNVFGPLQEGIEHSFFVKDERDQYFSDTIKVTIPASMPNIIGNMERSVSCKAQILKENILEIDPQKQIQYQWTLNPMTHYEVSQSEKWINLDIKNNNWTGTDTLHFSIDNHGAVLDTFIVIKNTADQAVEFISDTIGYAPSNTTGMDLDILSYVSDAETPDNELKIEIIDTDEFTINSTKDYLFFPEKKGEGKVVVSAEDAACHKDTVVFIIPYDNEPTEPNQAPDVPNETDFRYNFYYPPTLEQYSESVAVGGYFYPDVAFPTVNLKKYIKDDRPFEELKISLIPEDSAKVARGLTLTLEDSILKIRPKEGIFYGYPEKNNFGSIITERYNINLRVEDKEGLLYGFRIRLGVAERPFEQIIWPKPQLHYYLCKGDTIEVDLLANYRNTIPAMTGHVSKISENALRFNYLNTVQLDSNHLKVSVNDKNMYYSSVESLNYEPKVFSSFGTHYNFQKLDYFYFHIYPTCEVAPALNPVAPQQVTYTQEANLNLWDQLVYSNGPREVLWFLEDGENLNYSYNYQTGELNVKTINPQWTGKDTLVVRVKDTKDREAELAIAFTTEEQEAPIIYLTPQDITIKQGQTIPVVDLSNHVSDNNTLAEDIIWSVNSSAAEVSGSIQNQQLTLTVNDASWTGTSTIELIAEDEDGLTDTVIFTLTVDLETAIESFEETGCNWQSYPNPVTQTLTVETCAAGITSGKIKLLNTQGQVQFVQTFSQAGAIQVDVSRLNGGLYILQLESPSGENKVVGKVVVGRP